MIIGGLRARSGGDQPVHERLLYAARAAAVILLAASATAPVPDLQTGWRLSTTLLIATWLCAGPAAAAVMAGARLPALALTVAALALSSADETSMAAVAGYALAAALLLLPGNPTPVHNPLPLLLGVGWTVQFTAHGWWEFAVPAAVLLWTVIDERILLAAGLALFAGLIAAAGWVAEVDDTRGLLILAATRLGIPALLVAAGAALIRHRARI